MWKYFCTFGKAQTHGKFKTELREEAQRQLSDISLYYHFTTFTQLIPLLRWKTEEVIKGAEAGRMVGEEGYSLITFHL